MPNIGDTYSEVLGRDIQDIPRDPEELQEFIEGIINELPESERSNFFEVLQEDLAQIEEELEEAEDRFEDLEDGTASQRRRAENALELIDELDDFLNTIEDEARDALEHVADLNRTAVNGEASFGRYDITSGDTYTINYPENPAGLFEMPEETSGDPSVDNPFGTEGEEAVDLGIAESDNPAWDTDGNGIPDGDVNGDGVINYEDSRPVDIDILTKPHLMLQLQAEHLAEVAGWDEASGILTLRIYDNEGNTIHLKITNVDPENFSLIFNPGSVTTANIDSFRSIDPALLRMFYLGDSIESFAQEFGLEEDVERLSYIPGYSDIQESINSLDLLPYTGTYSAEALQTGIDRVFGLIDENKMLSDDVLEVMTELNQEWGTLGESTRAQLWTALTIYCRTHLRSEDFTAIFGPAILMIEGALNHTGELADATQNQILATILLESTPGVAGNYGGPEAVMSMAFSFGEGTTGEFSGEGAIETLEMLKDFSEQTGIFIAGVDAALASEEELQQAGGVVELTGELYDRLNLAAAAAGETFNVSSSGTSASEITMVVQTILSTWHETGKMSARDFRNTALEILMGAPEKAQDDAAAAFMTIIHDQAPELWDALMGDPAFLMGVWNIIDNGSTVPHNAQQIAEWLQQEVMDRSSSEDGWWGEDGDMLADDGWNAGWQAGHDLFGNGFWGHLVGAIAGICWGAAAFAFGDVLGGFVRGVESVMPWNW